MAGTLYKTKTPTTFEDGEYYQPKIDFEFIGDKRSYFVRETHGYWSDAEKRVVQVVKTYSPDEGYSTFREAEERYLQQVDRRIQDGFVHSFSLDPCKVSGDYIVYEYLGT
jgi:hypothetical protein